TRGAAETPVRFAGGFSRRGRESFAGTFAFRRSDSPDGRAGGSPVSGASRAGWAELPLPAATARPTPTGRHWPAAGPNRDNRTAETPNPADRQNKPFSLRKDVPSRPAWGRRDRGRACRTCLPETRGRRPTASAEPSPGPRTVAPGNNGSPRGSPWCPPDP